MRWASSDPLNRTKRPTLPTRGDPPVPGLRPHPLSWASSTLRGSRPRRPPAPRHKPLSVCVHPATCVAGEPVWVKREAVATMWGQLAELRGWGITWGAPVSVREEVSPQETLPRV